MAARDNPSQGGKPDKIMRDALILEINRETVAEDGRKVKKYRRIAAKVADDAMAGKEYAMHLVFDRVDGKLAPTPIVANIGHVTFMLQGAPGQTIDVTPQLQITGGTDDTDT